MQEEKYRSLGLQYKRWILKEYKHWTLLLNNDEQRYLGRAYVWLLRDGGMQRFSELTTEEYSELKVVIQEYESAMTALWKPDFMNYAWLANLFIHHGGHGHMHLIPRYEHERTFADTVFVDTRWGKNYAPADAFEITEEVYIKIQEALITELMQ